MRSRISLSTWHLSKNKKLKRQCRDCTSTLSANGWEHATRIVGKRATRSSPFLDTELPKSSIIGDAVCDGEGRLTSRTAVRVGVKARGGRRLDAYIRVVRRPTPVFAPTTYHNRRLAISARLQLVSGQQDRRVNHKHDTDHLQLTEDVCNAASIVARHVRTQTGLVVSKQPGPDTSPPRAAKCASVVLPMTRIQARPRECELAG